MKVYFEQAATPQSNVIFTNSASRLPPACRGFQFSSTDFDDRSMHSTDFVLEKGQYLRFLQPAGSGPWAGSAGKVIKQDRLAPGCPCQQVERMNHDQLVPAGRPMELNA